MCGDEPAPISKMTVFLPKKYSLMTLLTSVFNASKTVVSSVTSITTPSGSPVTTSTPSGMLLDNKVCSILAAFKSFILFSAISLTCFEFTEPITSLPGSEEAFSFPAAFFKK